MRGTNKKRTVGLIIENLFTEFAQEVIQNVISSSRLNSDIDVVIVAGKYDPSDDPEDHQHRYKRVYNSVYRLEELCNFDGLIISLGSMEKIKREVIEKRYFESLKDTPKVFVVSDLEGQPSVNYDNSTGIDEAVDCLVNAYGLSRFCMLGGREDNVDARARKTLYADALARNKIEFTDRNYVSGDMSADTQEPARELLDNNPDVQAIFCVNDASAVGLFDIMAQRGLEPGKDIMVFGFDNTTAAGRMSPTLASIGASEVTLGQKAMEEVLSQMNGNPPKSVLIPTRIYGRESFEYEMYEYTTMELVSADSQFIYKMFDDCFYRYRYEFRDRESVNLPRLFYAFMSKILKTIRSKYLSVEDYDEICKLIDIFFDNGAMDYTDAGKFTKSVELLQNSVNYLAGNNRNVNRLFARMKDRAIIALAENKLRSNDKLITGRQKIQNMMVETVSYSQDTESAVNRIVRNFDKLGLMNSALYLFEHSVTFEEDKEELFPPSIDLKCVMKAGELYVIPKERQGGPTGDMFRRVELPSKCSEYVPFPIFYKESIYGFLVCEYSDEIANSGEYFADQLARTLYMNENFR
ncbi:DNA-binding transcriptional regulator, LacI/PurR family [Oscillospiraceae bacterium]|nr:DNA-binding transcriptional regulator, LacI/PurR family [Oscillospiraceae bacterium]